jgi:hypothetical protein
VGHPSLRELRLRWNCAATARAGLGVGAMLHALVAANAPALKVLDAQIELRPAP